MKLDKKNKLRKIQSTDTYFLGSEINLTCPSPCFREKCLYSLLQERLGRLYEMPRGKLCVLRNFQIIQESEHA